MGRREEERRRGISGRALAVALAGIAFAACGGASGSAGSPAGERAGTASTPAAPAKSASPEFWKHWGDGRAELDGYRITTPRYGELRRGHAVLIYVTEPMDRRTWIKDDRGDVPPEHRVNVLKLNHALEFRTGIYPYSVMTSVFAPVDGLFPVRFAPAKIALSAQEWCGMVYHRIDPAAGGFRSEIRSYFSSEGDRDETVPAPPGTLYEDALFIQLRELDGPFNAGKDWKGSLVPSLWWARKAHAPLRPEPATIARVDAERDGVPVTRFTITRGSASRTIDVEKASPRKILGWSGPDGEQAALAGSARLAYWKLNRPGDESYLESIGLKPE